MGLAVLVSVLKIAHAYVWPYIGIDRRAANDVSSVFGTYRPMPSYWTEEEEARIARGRERLLRGEVHVDDPAVGARAARVSSVSAVEEVDPGAAEGP